MDKVSIRFISSTLLAIAVSILLVGVVWASSTAQQSSSGAETVSSTTTSPPEEDAVDDGEDGGGDAPATDTDSEVEKLRDQVDSLTSQVEELSALVSAMNSDVEKIDSLSKKTSTRLDTVQALAEQASQDASRAITASNDLGDRIVIVELRSSQLNDEGIYVGSITPEQFTRKLTPTDIRGNWPLGRVEGDLEVKYILMPFSGNCSSRYDSYTVLVNDPFRRITCERIPK